MIAVRKNEDLHVILLVQRLDSCYPTSPLSFLSLIPQIFQHSLFSIMAAPANMATTSTILRSIVDHTKEDDQMNTILHSIQFWKAHVMLG
jgi:hypothetical protein